MRLIETTTLTMETYYDREIPPYAILSHTWEDEEVTLQDWSSWRRNRMKGFDKIRMTCRLAASDGIKYAWVDTCCIDKSNSTELSEAINSMFRWYQRAKVCYAYLSDLHLPASVSDDTMALKPFLRGCRWFSRGWTLQELIAPSAVLFYQHDWSLVGNKWAWNKMLSGVTGISSGAMISCKLTNYSIAERMSWAADRETAREEDKAYCLLGIFNVNMPMLYGEGAKSFRRLQEEIIRTRYDVSVFAWTVPFPNNASTRRDAISSYGFTGAFADTPGNFHPIPARLIRRQQDEVSVTNAGVKLNLELCLVRVPCSGMSQYVLPLCSGGWRTPGKDEVGDQYIPALGVGLVNIRPGTFMRRGLGRLVEIPHDDEAGIARRIRCPDAYILIDPPDSIEDLVRCVYWLEFRFPPNCRLVNAWPSRKWNDAEKAFMIVEEEPRYGSLLVEVHIPTLNEDNGDVAIQRRAGEVMILFNGLPAADKSSSDMQYTIVPYRQHQSMLDIINMRIGARDMDVQEMRRTLRNFAIPRQRTAAVSVEGTEQYIYVSVDIDFGSAHRSYSKIRSAQVHTFRSSSVTLDNEQQPWDV